MYENKVLSCVSEIEEAVSSALDVETEFLQLSAGKQQFRMSTFEASGVRLANTMSTSRVRWHDVKKDNSIHLMLPTQESVGGAKGNSHAWDATSLFCLSRPGEIDLIGESHCEAFEIIVDESWVTDMGLPTELGVCIAASSGSFSRLQRFVRRAFNYASTTELSGDTAAMLSEQVLGALEPILLSAPTNDPEETTAFRNRHRIVARAEEIMNDWDPEARLEISNLCSELGVKRGTLHRVFRQELGLGPMEFLRIKKFHRLRTELLAAEKGAVTVADIAATIGLQELGRMAAKYRDYFGELPSETLARTRH